jgi:hypothetical protein
MRKRSSMPLIPVSPQNSGLRQRLETGLRRGVGHLLHRLERRYGYFLPYHLSEMKNDEFLRELRKLARERAFQTALLMGAAKGEGVTEAFLSGVMENENKPTTFCISSSANERTRLENAFADNDRVNCYGIAIRSEDEPTEQLQMTATKIKEDYGLNRFDVVVIDGSNFKQLRPSAQLQTELHGATHILLDDINSSYNHANYHQLVRDPDFVAVSCNLEGLRDGYAIFEKTEAQRRQTIPARADW